MDCENCAYYIPDEEDGMYYCDAYIDEDDLVRLTERNYKSCPYRRSRDEYAVVRHQM